MYWSHIILAFHSMLPLAFSIAIVLHDLHCRRLHATTEPNLCGLAFQVVVWLSGEGFSKISPVIHTLLWYTQIFISCPVLNESLRMPLFPPSLCCQSLWTSFCVSQFSVLLLFGCKFYFNACASEWKGKKLSLKVLHNCWMYFNVQKIKIK